MTIVLLDPSDPNWTEVAGFFIALGGSIATVAIAIVAIVISVRSGRTDRSRAASDKEERLRSRRESFATDLLLWNRNSQVHMIIGGDSLLADEAFVESGHHLDARAKVLGDDGAHGLLSLHRLLREDISLIEDEKRTETSALMVASFESYVRDWVDNPVSANAAILEFSRLLAEDIVLRENGH
ncbi:hypothetical protein [Subtercola sp. RTI3]|uniref:hypothetical protein n=1 Tax=Subtercola sp. RTI3 TaxID=3048639 RepID=UPI002B232B96|nr:hypothetical protein [Subtercola sp. RTI3]MEA9983676.1 hypothetical protein [Subtercola sp. RTI3]